MEKPAISIASHAEGVLITHQLLAQLCEYAYYLNLFWTILSLLGFGRNFRAVLGYPIGLLMSCLAGVPLLMLESHP